MTSRILVASFFLINCGGRVIAGHDAGPIDDASLPFDVVVPLPDAPPPPPQCNGLQPGQKAVPVIQVASDPPPFALNGAALASGLYELDSLVQYNGTGGMSGTMGSTAERLHITPSGAGFTFDIVSVTDNQAPQWSSGQATETGPGQLDVAVTCPGQSTMASVFFIAAAGKLTLRITGSGSVAVDTDFTYVGP